MKRVCVIGNSHLACMKLGWDRMRQRHPGCEITFFGSRGALCQHLQLCDRRLIPANDVLAADLRWISGGLTAIALDDFDAFVLMAMQFAPTRVSQVARQFSYVDVRLDPRKRLISRECFLQSAFDGLRNSIAVSVAEKIRSAVSKPIVIVPQPHVSAAWRETETYRTGFGNAPAGCWPLLGEIWQDCALKAARAVAAEALLQPGETMVDSFFTEHRFCKASVMLADGLATEHPEDDFVHMNAEYGEIVLDALFSPGRGMTAATGLRQDRADAAA